MVFLDDLTIYTGSGEPSFFATPGTFPSRESSAGWLANGRRKDCRKVATLRSDLSGIPASDFEVVNSGNGNWYKVSYDLEMSFEATLSFRLVFKGMVVSLSPQGTINRALLTVGVSKREDYRRVRCRLRKMRLGVRIKPARGWKRRS
ncbi:hypothetical protein IMZ48_39310 [Candidatus Bathyarchaeota archaeon]|nr:hypothetical protein [Candidatus Bathyarchaeota archaeon]